jgi:hypothetical protein
VTTIPIFNARITYLGLNTSGNSLPILSIGCWLPRGFSYNNGSSNFEQGTPVYSTETVLPCSGNVAVVWTFPAGTTLYSLQTDMGQSPGSQTLAVNFSYTTSLTKLPECLPWVVWGTDAGDFTWDADITVFDMTASAGNPGSGYIDIETFLPKSQTRMLGNALPGDYVATGGSNLTDLNGDGNRETYIPSSSSTVNVIPAGSMVEGGGAGGRCGCYA